MKGINQVAQRLLALDPEVRDAFSALGDRVIEIQLTELGQSFYLTPVPEGLSITTERPHAVATVIKGTVIAMISNTIHQKLFGGYRTEGLSVEGDMELAKEFNHLMQQYSMDWEELLSGFVGDVSAHNVGNAARDVRSWGIEAHESLLSDISEYLQEEARWLPTKPELESFYQEVDQLRDDFARFEARFSRMQPSRKS